MTFLQRIFSFLRLETSEQPLPTPPGMVTTPSTRRGRPVSASLLRTVDVVRSRPDVTPRELAQQLSVTPAYARTLLRRAQARLSAPAGQTVVTASPADFERNLADLQARLDRTEKGLTALSSTPPVARGAWNLNRRAEVLRLAASEVVPAEIAHRLSIPAGEVDFILKVDSLLQGAKSVAE